MIKSIVLLYCVVLSKNWFTLNIQAWQAVHQSTLRISTWRVCWWPWRRTNWICFLAFSWKDSSIAKCRQHRLRNGIEPRRFFLYHSVDLPAAGRCTKWCNTSRRRRTSFNRRVQPGTECATSALNQRSGQAASYWEVWAWNAQIRLSDALSKQITNTTINFEQCYVINSSDSFIYWKFISTFFRFP